MRDLGGGELWLLDANLGREAREMQWESEGVDKYFFAVFKFYLRVYECIGKDEKRARRVGY